MNILDLVRGMLFGYGLKIVQILATLLVVPYLLSVLGIDRYGRIFAILSALGVLNLISDGLKLSFARSISQAIPRGAEATSRYVGAGLKAMLLLGGGLAAVAFVFDRPLLGFLGVPADREYLSSVVLAAGIVVLENGFFSFYAYLTARGRLDFLNAITAVEVILRNLSFVVYFNQYPARADAYFGIFLAWTALRYAGMAAYSVASRPADFRGLGRGKIKEAWGAVSYSVPLTLDYLQHYVFQRFSIPLVNRFIGPAEAGLLALGINTISGSLAQVLFTVARPLLVPIAARLDLENMNQSKRSLLLRVDATFALCVALTMIPLIALMPTVIGVWLGGDYDAMILPSQILVAGTAFTAGFNIRRSLLVGQGKGVAIVKVSLGLMLLAVGVFAWALVGARDWVLVTAVIAGFSALTSVLAVGLVFERHLLIPEARQARGTLRRTVAWSLAIVNAMLVSRMAPSGLSVDLLIPAIGSVLGVLVVAHLLVIPARDLISTLRTLKGGARRSLFADENGA